MVAGLGSGAMFAIVQRQPPVDIIMNAVLFALANAAIFKVTMMFLPSGFLHNMLDRIIGQ